MNPDEYGGEPSNRTFIPKLVKAGSLERPIFVLDTIGLGEIKDSDKRNKLYTSLEKANEVFRRFAHATIIVCSQSQDNINEEAKSLALITSSHNPDAQPLAFPTMTCFNKADEIPKIPDIQNQPLAKFCDILRNVALEREKIQRPYDLRTIGEDMFRPRVFSCFEPRVSGVSLPAEGDTHTHLGSVVITVTNVQRWLEEVFETDRNRRFRA